MTKYRKTEKILSSNLDRESLIDLSDLVKEKMNAGTNIENFCICIYRGDAYYEGNDLETLLDKNKIDKIDSVDFRATNWNDFNEMDKSIEIRLHPMFSNCTINSSDEVWLKGKFLQLEDFFKKNQPWYGDMRSKFISIWGVFLLLSTATLIIASFSGNLFVALTSIFSMMLLGFAIYLYLRGMLFPHVSFNIRKNTSTKPESRLPVISDLTAIIAAVLTIINIILTIIY